MFGRQGGKASARNMTPERPARAKKASLEAAEVRTAKSLAREGLKRQASGERECDQAHACSSRLSNSKGLLSPT